jgi:NADH dehydrogenase
MAQKIVILGGGFGGVYTAMFLEKLIRHAAPEIEVTLVSRDNYFLMTPFLFEAGSGILEPRHAVVPIRQMIRTSRFIEAEVTGVDFDQKIVHASHVRQGINYAIPYDQLVVGLGAITNRKMIKGADYAMAFKTLSDALWLRSTIIDLFEQAEVEQNEQVRAEMLTCVIIGAGLVGVELMGELTSFLKELADSYPNVKKHGTKLYLLEGGPKILPELEASLGDYAKNVFTKRGVEVRGNTRVAEITLGQVHLPGGEVLKARTIIISAGVAPNPIVEKFPVKLIKGRVAVEGTMRSESKPELWAIGDAAYIPDPKSKDGKPYPQLAQHALREAKVLAHNIVAATRNQPLKAFDYKSKGTLASLGARMGVGRVMNIKIFGFIAWWVWRSYYLTAMPRFDRKARIVIDWTVALLFKADIVKLVLRPSGRDGEEVSLNDGPASASGDGAGGGNGEKPKPSADGAGSPRAAVPTFAGRIPDDGHPAPEHRDGQAPPAATIH